MKNTRDQQFQAKQVLNAKILHMERASYIPGINRSPVRLDWSKQEEKLHKMEMERLEVGKIKQAMVKALDFIPMTMGRYRRVSFRRIK